MMRFSNRFFSSPPFAWETLSGQEGGTALEMMNQHKKSYGE